MKMMKNEREWEDMTDEEYFKGAVDDVMAYAYHYGERMEAIARRLVLGKSEDYYKSVRKKNTNVFLVDSIKDLLEYVRLGN